ncbi:TPA: hypothetical protein ACJRUL_001273 [Streptococcus agalactiae]
MKNNKRVIEAYLGGEL